MATTRSGSVVGKVTIGTPANKEVNVAIDPITQTLTKHMKGIQATAGAGATIELPRGNASDLAMIWMKAITSADESIADNVANVLLTLGNGTTTVLLPDVSVLLHICNPKSEEDISKVEIVDNAATPLVIESLIAGE